MMLASRFLLLQKVSLLTSNFTRFVKNALIANEKANKATSVMVLKPSSTRDILLHPPHTTTTRIDNYKHPII